MRAVPQRTSPKYHRVQIANLLDACAGRKQLGHDS